MAGLFARPTWAFTGVAEGSAWRSGRRGSPGKSPTRPHALAPRGEGAFPGAEMEPEVTAEASARALALETAAGSVCLDPTTRSHDPALSPDEAGREASPQPATQDRFFWQ